MTLRAFIAGYYGAGNAGDEWILSGLLAALRRREPDTGACVLSYNPEATRREHGVEAVGWGDIEALAAAVRWSSLVIVGGGGLWQDYWGFDPLAFFSRRPGAIAGYGTPILLAHLLGRPCALVGVGVGPLQAVGSRDAVRDLALMAGLVSVRDPGSRGELVACGLAAERVHLGADLALLADLPSAGVRELSDAPVIGVSLRPWEFAGDPQIWEAAIAAALRAWIVATGGRVTFVPLQESPHAVEDDRRVTERVAAAVGVLGRARVIPAGLPPADRIAELASADLVLGMRYHSLLPAMLAGVPCVGLGYDPKVRRLMDDAGAVGMVFDLPGLDPAALAERLMRSTGQPPLSGDSVAALRARAEESLNQALRISQASTTTPPVILASFVLHQSAYLGSLENAVRERFGLPVSYAPRAEAGLASVDAASAQARRIESERDEARMEMAGLRAQLAALRSTAGVRLLDRYWRFTRRLAPEGSSRRRLYHLVRNRFRQCGSWLLRSLLFSSGKVSSGSRAVWPADRIVALPGDEEWLLALDGYLDRENAAGNRGVVFFLAGTRFEGSEGQRSYHLARLLARRGRKVVFGYWRWEINTGHPPASSEREVLEVPLDVLLANPDRTLAMPRMGAGVVFLEFPFPGSMRFLATANARGYVTIYDAVDDWQAFHAAGQAPWYDLAYESSLGAACDVILAVSPGLVNLVGERCRRRPHLVPNGWAPDFVSRVHPAEVDRGTITLGYFGHLTESWFDWDLLVECARRRPAWRVHLIGYGGGWRTSRLPVNLIYHGKLPHALLPSHAARWDVGIIPFRRGPVAAAADPIKTYEYLALGLPVVVTGVRPPVGADDLVQIVGDVGSFVRAVEAAASSETDQSAERRAFAASSTWEQRVEAILLLLESDEPGLAWKRFPIQAAA